MSAAWTNFEGHVIEGGLPLLRCIASSDEGAVFRTESARLAPTPLVLKVVRIDPTAAHVQLSRWRAAANLSHPHLIRIFEAGPCQLGELHCLYALMEQADQNLAQLLRQRALEETEVREMLAPTLSALAYLHENKFVLGQLKPSNVLAMGDQLKLASDTVRAAGESAGSVDELSAYDAPEARDGISSAAGDIWALGMTICEALTRRRPSIAHEGSGEVELPADLREPFRDIVARCLKRNPDDRPKVADIQARLRGEHAAAESPAVAAVDVKSESEKAPTIKLVIRAEILPEGDLPISASEHANRRALALIVGVAALLALGWLGLRVFRSEPTSVPAISEQRDVEPAPATPTPAPRETPPVVSDAAAPKPARSSTESVSPRTTSVAPKPTKTEPVSSEARKQPSAPLSPINEVMPNASRSALDTIRGTIRVVVRVTVARDGKVTATTAEVPGPSRYFERVSLEAARKWTFAPSETEQPRTALIRFSFTRAEATARMEPMR